MSRLRGQVTIHNHTDQPLTRAHLALPHGQWTDPWHPPESIAPGASAEFRSEGRLVAGIPSKGTEGRIRFRLGNDPARELYIHWNVPHLTGPYGNTFHVWAPEGYEADHTGHSSGLERPRAMLTVRLRPTAVRRVAGFSPRDNGFPFSNTEWSKDLPVMTLRRLYQQLKQALPAPLRPRVDPLSVTLPDVPLTRGHQGLCGGMVFAAMDYWNAGQRPPDRTVPTSERDPLFRYVRDRLVDSFDFGGRGHRWLAYSSPHYPDGDEGFAQNVLGLTKGRSWVTFREEWPRIREDIERGQLSPIGLVQTRDLAIGDNHQVLAYAYRQSGQRVTLYVYDPNAPGGTSTIGFDITDTSVRVNATRSFGSLPIHCIFRMDGYQPRQPVQAQPGRGSPSLSVRDLLLELTDRPHGSLAHALGGPPRPVSIRSLMP